MTDDVEAALARLAVMVDYEQERTASEAYRTIERHIEAQAARAERLEAALRDALSGWHYIRQRYGDLDGVAWDRVEDAVREALAETEAKP